MTATMPAPTPRVLLFAPLGSSQLNSQQRYNPQILNPLNRIKESQCRLRVGSSRKDNHGAKGPKDPPEVGLGQATITAGQEALHPERVKAHV